MRTKIGILILALIAVACSTGAGDSASSQRRNGGGSRGGGRGHPGASAADDAVSVKAFEAIRRPISDFITSNTTLEAIRQVTIAARVNALVESIEVEEGDIVRAGQVVAVLADREISNEFEQAKIAVEQAQFSLQQAEVRSQLSEANFQRSASLLEQKLISRQEFDQAALSNRTDSLAEDVAKRQLEAATSRLAASQIQLDYTEIHSSISGVVTARSIEVGQRVSPNEAAFTVAEFDPLWARIYIPERELTKVSIGQQARLQLQALPERDFQARIRMISPTVDADSGTVKVTLEVNRQGILRPGMFGTAFLATETHADAVVIPKRAVVRERGENRVFVVQADSTVAKKDVTLGFMEEDLVEIVSGLEAGDTVVTVGLEGLNEGYPVNIMARELAGQPTEVVAAPAPVASTRPPGSAGGGEGRRGGERGQRGGRGGFDAERIRAFLPRLLENPEIKKIYESKLAADPNFVQNTAKFQEFFNEIRPMMGGAGGRGRARRP